jgi:hypothetical protein
MAKIPVFDSLATLDSRNTDITAVMQTAWSSAITEATAVKSQPVRGFCSVGDIDVISWEFYASTIASGNVFAIKWWMEFFPDSWNQHQAPRLLDDNGIAADARTWIGQTNAEWAREVLALSGGGTAVEHYRCIRTMTFENTTGVAAAHPVRWVPLSVHAPWIRLGLYFDSAGSTGYTSPNDVRLRVYANVGGHSEWDFLKKNGDKPYAYGLDLTIP